MSSTFISKGNSKWYGKGPFKTKSESEVFVQFVPGIVLDVATSSQSKSWISAGDTNTILAKSHAPDKSQFSGINSGKRYIPLLRGITDVPTIGDPVLLATFGGVEYYLGPLNSLNSPNFNIDIMNVNESPTIKDNKPTKQTNSDYIGMSNNFRKINYPRLEKPYNKDLDDPKGKKVAIDDIHGDLTLEGRHGNSIRIGSRDRFPYCIISNGRSVMNTVESLNDGAIIGLFESGRIRDHFKYDSKQKPPTEGAPDPVSVESEDKPFVLGSDSIEEPKRLIGDELYNYEYKGSQLITSSDKITLNSTSNNVILSSFNNFIVGAGNSCNIITENETIIESSNIYLGKQAKIKADDGKKPEPLVLGIKLKEFLLDVLKVLEKAHGVCQGSPIPVMDSSMKPLVTEWKSLIRKLKQPEFLSQYHYIEDNENKPE